MENSISLQYPSICLNRSQKGLLTGSFENDILIIKGNSNYQVLFFGLTQFFIRIVVLGEKGGLTSIPFLLKMLFMQKQSASERDVIEVCRVTLV
jgi:hypothetical protein